MIIFQQGAPKSASSFCSQLLREIAAENGYTQEGMREVLGEKQRGGFVTHLRSIEALLDDVPEYSVIKTHTQPFAAEPLLRNNLAIGFVTLRDPLDSVRSLLDHAEASRADNKEEFADVTTSEEAGRIILLHLSYSMMWLRNPNVFPVYYEQLRSKPHKAAVMMAEKMGLTVNPKRIARKFSDKTRVRRFNVGETGRGQKLLTDDDQQNLARMFAIFYESKSWINTN